MVKDKYIIQVKIYADFVQQYEGYWIKKYQELCSQILQDLKFFNNIEDLNNLIEKYQEIFDSNCNLKRIIIDNDGDVMEYKPTKILLPFEKECADFCRQDGYSKICKSCENYLIYCKAKFISKNYYTKKEVKK